MFGLTPFNNYDLTTNKEKEYLDFYNLVDDFFSSDFPTTRLLEHDTFKLDVKDLDDSYVVEAEMPGYDRSEIDLDYHDNRLTIKAHKETKETDKDEDKTNYIHRERHYESVERNVYLKDINTEKILAKLDNGVLTVEVPKLETSEITKKIEIK